MIFQSRYVHSNLTEPEIYQIKTKYEQKELHWCEKNPQAPKIN